METDTLVGHDRPGDFMVWLDRGFSYAELGRATADWIEELAALGVTPGAVVAVESDYSPRTVALLIALIQWRCIIVPVQRPCRAAEDVQRVARVEHWISIDEDENHRATACEREAPHRLIETLHERRHGGLIVFSSGSSGSPKATVHDIATLLTRFAKPREPLSLLAFLRFEHLGGLNTLFHALSSGGTLFTVADRTPDAICSAIARHRIKVLPASPTFLNLMLLSKAHERHDLGSLEVITYGAEAMPEPTLRRLQAAFPEVKLKQTYGLNETGALPTRSPSSTSLWLELGVEHRVVDGILQLNAPTTMLGYLNAPSPFTPDGWFVTNDAVEVRGDQLRILGRASELINVGGEKVFPQEVEAVILELDNIQDVMVHDEDNAITGSIVCAVVRLDAPEEPRLLARRVKRHCRARLEPFKVPVKVTVTDETLMTERGKKRRAGRGGDARSG